MEKAKVGLMQAAKIGCSLFYELSRKCINITFYDCNAARTPAFAFYESAAFNVAIVAAWNLIK